MSTSYGIIVQATSVGGHNGEIKGETEEGEFTECVVRLPGVSCAKSAALGEKLQTCQAATGKISSMSVLER
jgi:hypothetical protein